MAVKPNCYCFPINRPRFRFLGVVLCLLHFGFLAILVMSQPAEDQLIIWRKNNKGLLSRATDPRGCPVPSLTSALGLGSTGPLLLQDSFFLDAIAHFDRERIPERVVHAKGAGAYGYFEVTHDITKWTRARVFEVPGKRTPVTVRFSTVAGEMGSADTVAGEPRGFSVKFYTDDGNWDLVGFNVENFGIRDPVLFPSFVHSRKRNPQTHLRDPNSVWDFNSLRPETTLHTMFLFSDRGIPDGYRHMHGFGCHTFKFVNAAGVPVYVKFHLITDQGLKGLTLERAQQLAGEDPDYANRDLYNAIAQGAFPSWTVAVQIMSLEEAEKYQWNPFDITKVWLLRDFPLHPVGKLVLDRNPGDFFSEIEQSAFHPGNLVPGIEPSPDRLLQGRLFSYSDTQRYRLGVNFQQIPVNRPLSKATTYTRDGASCTTENGAGAPNYFPNSFSGPVEDLGASQALFPASGIASRLDTGDDDNYSQATVYWTEALSPDERQRLVNNIAFDLARVTDDEIRNRAIAGNFEPVSKKMGLMLREAVATFLAEQGKKKK